MLNFIYYPVSFILWCWHKVFGFVLGDTNAVAWALSIVFLVFTLRALLLKPAIKQVRSMRKMQEFQPQIQALKKKYPNDRQRQAAEMQKLQKEHGVSPLGGCLPMVFQIPVFIGLNHVLRNFTMYPHRSNYFFSNQDVQSYLAAKLFDAHLGDAIFNTSLVGGSAMHHATWMWGVAPVAIPLMIIASIATHFTARLSVKRQVSMSATGGPQSKLMGTISMWVFPLGVLAFGGALPVGLLMYWVSNNVWTFGQQHLVFGRIDKEEAEKKKQAQEHRDALAPRPGQKPTQQRKKANPSGVNAGPQQAKGQAGQTQGGQSKGQKPQSTGRQPAQKGSPARTGAAVSQGGAKTGKQKSGSGGSGKGQVARGDKRPSGANQGSQKRNEGSGEQSQRRGSGDGKKAGVSAGTKGSRNQGTAGKSGGGGRNGRADTGVPGLISDRERKKQSRKAR